MAKIFTFWDENVKETLKKLYSPQHNLNENLTILQERLQLPHKLDPLSVELTLILEHAGLAFIGLAELDNFEQFKDFEFANIRAAITKHEIEEAPTTWTYQTYIEFDRENYFPGMMTLMAEQSRFLRKRFPIGSPSDAMSHIRKHRKDFRVKKLETKLDPLLREQALLAYFFAAYKNNSREDLDDLYDIIMKRAESIDLNLLKELPSKLFDLNNLDELRELKLNYKAYSDFNFQQKIVRTVFNTGLIKPDLDKDYDTYYFNFMNQLRERFIDNLLENINNIQYRGVINFPLVLMENDQNKLEFMTHYSELIKNRTVDELVQINQYCMKNARIPIGRNKNMFDWIQRLEYLVANNTITITGSSKKRNKKFTNQDSQQQFRLTNKVNPINGNEEQYYEIDLSDRDNLELAEYISPYPFMQKIGEGKEGKVFLAHNTELNSNIAIKILNKHDYELARNLNRMKEARIENVVQILDAGDIVKYKGFKRPTIVMEYVDGPSLNAKSPLSIKEYDLLRYYIHVLKGLEDSQKLGIYNHDINPSNIKIDTKSKIAKIMDWGIVNLDENKRRRFNRKHGGKGLYSVGSTIYEFYFNRNLAGSRKYNENSEQFANRIAIEKKSVMNGSYVSQKTREVIFDACKKFEEYDNNLLADIIIHTLEDDTFNNLYEGLFRLEPRLEYEIMSKQELIEKLTK